MYPTDSKESKSVQLINQTLFNQILNFAHIPKHSQYLIFSLNIFMYLYSINVFKDWIPHAINPVKFLSISLYGELEDVLIQSPFPLQSKDELLRWVDLLLPLDAAIMKSWHKSHDE